MHPHRMKRQQNTDITVVPSASGVSGFQTASDPSATQLVVGSDTDSNPSSTDGPDFAPGFVSLYPALGPFLISFRLSRTSIVVTTTMSSTHTPSQTPTETPALSGAKSEIPLSTVIGVCIGTFIGASLLICFSVWFYRRSSRRPPPRRARHQQHLAQSHGINPAAPWTRFDDGEDKWEGRNEISEKNEVANVDLPPMNQRPTSPHSTGKSLTSDGHFGSEHDVTRQSLPFSQYHPKLPSQMTLGPPRSLGVDDRSTTPEGSTTGTFLPLGTVHIESGKMSPTFNMAKMTPPATASRLHRWESAEVVDPDAHAQEVEVHHDPFSEKSTPTSYSPTETFGDRRSFHNPFFNAHPGIPSRRPSVTRKQSAMSVSSDPFIKDEIMVMPKPSYVSHAPHESSSSGGSVGNEKAMQSLIAALELPQEVIEERLRIASMHPSEASRYSTAMDTPVGHSFQIPETEDQYFVQ